MIPSIYRAEFRGDGSFYVRRTLAWIPGAAQEPSEDGGEVGAIGAPEEISELQWKIVDAQTLAVSKDGVKWMNEPVSVTLSNEGVIRASVSGRTWSPCE